MSYYKGNHATLSDRLPMAWISHAWMRNCVLAFVGTLLIAVCARIQIPFIPVPFTMQTFAVLLIGMVYGFRLGVSTLILYVAQGAIGLPMFAGGAGFAYLVGPTGGYLLGFVIAAAFVGYLAERGWDREVYLTFMGNLMGTAIILISGYLGLIAFMNLQQDIPLSHAAIDAWHSGVLPFILGGLAKTTLVAMILPLFWKP